MGVTDDLPELDEVDTNPELEPDEDFDPGDHVCRHISIPVEELTPADDDPEEGEPRVNYE